MIDGQGAVNTGNLDIAHNAQAGNIQQLFIGRFLLLRQQVGIVPLQKGCVIGGSRLPKGLILVLVQAGDLLGIDRDGPGLVLGVPVIADGGIQQQGQPKKEDQNQQDCNEMIAFFLHIGFSLPLRAGGSLLPPASTAGIAFCVCGDRLWDQPLVLMRFLVTSSTAAPTTRMEPRT